MATKIEQEKPAGSLEPLELTSLRDDIRERPPRSKQTLPITVAAIVATALAVAGAVKATDTVVGPGRVLACILVGVALSLPRTLGQAKASKSFREFFAKSRAINLIAAARFFLFGSRDVWFVVGLPVFLYSQGWRYLEVAGFLASWTIGYGLVQALAPSIIRRSADGLSREVPEARLWGAALTVLPLTLALMLSNAHMEHPDLVITVGLGIFGFVFAVISSLHSYLILAYAGSEKAAEDVGFYYAANAGGRLLGILLSGLLAQAGGMAACLWGSAAMLALCLAITCLLPSTAPAQRVPAVMSSTLSQS